MEEKMIFWMDTDTISEEELLEGDSYIGGEIYEGEEADKSS